MFGCFKHVSGENVRSSTNSLPQLTSRHPGTTSTRKQLADGTSRRDGDQGHERTLSPLSHHLPLHLASPTPTPQHLQRQHGFLWQDRHRSSLHRRTSERDRSHRSNFIMNMSWYLIGWQLEILVFYYFWVGWHLEVLVFYYFWVVWQLEILVFYYFWVGWQLEILLHASWWPLDREGWMLSFKTLNLALGSNMRLIFDVIFE